MVDHGSWLWIGLVERGIQLKAQDADIDSLVNACMAIKKKIKDGPQILSGWNNKHDNFLMTLFREHVSLASYDISRVEPDTWMKRVSGTDNELLRVRVPSVPP